MQGQAKNTGFWLAGGTAQDGPAMAAAAAPAPAVVLLLGSYGAQPRMPTGAAAAALGANKRRRLELPRQSAAARPALTT